MKKLYVWALAICMLGCKATKDNHAYTRVIGDPKLSERVYNTLEVSHPCINTVTVGNDVTVRDTVIDQSALNAAEDTIDSLLYKLLNPPDTNYISIDSIRQQIISEVKHKATTITVTHTVTDTIIDSKQIGELMADKNNLQGQNLQLVTQVSQLHKNNARIWLYFAILGLLLLISIVLYIKKK